jgi:hypothetical protein
LSLVSERRLAAAPQAGGKAVASDEELMSKYGDPEIKAKDPRDWNGR